MPHAELGAYAASRKSGSFFPAVKPSPPATPRDVTLLDVRIAEGDPLFATVAHIHRGTRVGLLGLVRQTGAGRFALTRFYITCCIADAQPVTLDVDWGRPVVKNHWVFVTGKLERPGKHYTVTARRRGHAALAPRPLSRIHLVLSEQAAASVGLPTDSRRDESQRAGAARAKRLKARLAGASGSQRGTLLGAPASCSSRAVGQGRVFAPLGQLLQVHSVCVT